MGEDRDARDGGDVVVAEATELVLAVLSRKRATWTPWNVDAEASRALKAHRFPTSHARDDATTAVVTAVAARSVLLTPPPVAPTPAELRRVDGSSAFRHHHAERYTCQPTLDAEARLLTAGRDTSGPALTRLDLAHVPGPAPRPEQPHAPATAEATTTAGLHDDQVTAIGAIATSGRVVDVLVGPAGSGKTRTLAGLRQVWEAEHGADSVVGLAAVGGRRAGPGPVPGRRV
ncbi:MAG: AAA family ATPase [Actinomycetales bacterium]|nr:AAA family ATPase [Actinomycetales bacterium]